MTYLSSRLYEQIEFTTFRVMRCVCKIITLKILLFSIFYLSNAQSHPMETLGKDIFRSFQNEDFISFYNHSIFSLDEQAFKKFLFQINNKNIRDNLIKQHKQEFPENFTFSQKWNLAFQHLWRKELRHLANYPKAKIRNDDFLPIVNEAKEYGIQWKVTKLVAVEVLVPVSWEKGRFLIKKDLNIDGNNSLFLARNLNYRFVLDKLTYSKAFMIGTVDEDSDKSFDNGITNNGAGQGDVLIRFNSQSPDKLFYFSPDQKKAGGLLSVINHEDGYEKNPNQRLDLIITFSYGVPMRAYQIIVKDALMSAKGPIFTERPKFMGQVPLPIGLSFAN